MKVILFLAALFVSAYAEFKPATHADLIKYRNECVEKLEIAPDVVEEFKTWKFENPKSPQYIECIFEKMDLYENGNFNVDNLAIQLSHGSPSDDLKEKITNCITPTLEGAEKAFQGFNCFKENNLYMIQRSVGSTQ